MPRPSGQQVQMHYDPYNAHPGRNVYVSEHNGYPRAVQHHQPYGPGYEYYNKQRMNSPPQAISPAHTSPADAAVATTDTKKKIPRPYTEYNIFFQLERERILAELEDKKREEGAEGGDEQPSSPQERILNLASDDNDVLPRPPQFAHLKLLPKWYDSAVRIAQNKMNKSKRKHRKTHGLVGFLDLTKMISKAWAEADADTKSYCKRVADRQLGYYKAELKAMKTQQQYATMGQQQTVHNMPMGYDGGYGFHNRMHMTHHPPPPHYWQQQQHGMSHKAHASPPYPEQYPRTPPSQETFIEDQRHHGRPSGKLHPLEELMLRRKIYGSRSNATHPKRSPSTWPSYPQQTVPVGASLPHSQTYVSPAETGSTVKDAVTPSPPRKHEPSTPTLPVKKRLKTDGPAENRNERSPVSFDSGAILGSSGVHNSSPISSSFPSPTDMMSNVFNSSPISASSYQRALGPYLSDSPMPYMDFSPQDSIGSPQRHPATVPSHLALPGSYAATSIRAPHQRGCRSPFSDDLANDILDFDEEEMDYMWNQLANSARARRNAKAAAAKELFRMNNESTAITSPGHTNALGLAHSFASPAAPAADTNKISSPGATATATAPPLPSIDEEKHDGDNA